MREAGAVEAASTLSSLLDLVQQGEQIVITRQGKPIARLVPEVAQQDVSAAKAAIERIRARRGDVIRAEEWARFRDEGRS